jgi:hypothetical protein
MLTAPDGSRSLRHLPQDWVVPGRRYEIQIDVVATEIHAEGTLYITPEWFELSDDAGVTWTPVGATKEAAISLGAFTAGQRKSYVLSYVVPSGYTDGWTATAQPVIGWGID